MTQRAFIWNLLIAATVMLASCKPEPKEVPMPAGKEKWVINSRLTENRTLLVAVCKTLPPDQIKAGNDMRDVAEKLMVDGLTVTLESAGRLDTLFRAGRGIYGREQLNVPVGTTGYLRVSDPVSGRTLHANSFKVPDAVVDSVKPYARVRSTDTLCGLNIWLRQPDADESWYLLSFYKWDSRRAISQGGRITLAQVINGSGNMNDKVVLVKGSEFKNGRYELHKVLPFIKGHDTMVVNIARIEKGYYEFVQAQLKSANWLNQLIGETINYPGNVQNGLGYFTLHKPEVFVFRMREFL